MTEAKAPAGRAWLTPRPRWWAPGIVAALIAFETVASAQSPPTLAADEEISASGAVRSRFVLTFSPPDYAQLKKRVPDPANIAQLGVEADVDAVMTAAQGAYDDATHSVIIAITQAGAAKNRGGGRWEYSVELDDSEASLLRTGPDTQGRTTLEFSIQGGVSGRGSVALPHGATEVHWDSARNIIGYTLPAPSPGGRPRLVLGSFDVNERLMGAVYKAYADRQRQKRQWTAKAVFTNQGTAALEGLRVRFRAVGYSEWSPFDRHVEVAPGQTIVASFYPQLDAKVAALRSPTAATIEVEWTYRDARGQDATEGESKPVQILGGNQFVLKRTTGLAGGGAKETANLLENGDLLTAWITPEDPVVREFSTWATRRAAGAPAGQTSDDSADLRILRAIWELWIDNDFTYQSPGTFVQTTGRVPDGAFLKSYDETQIQTIRFPRDTIKDRSGTCLETTVLFASMAKAAGLREAGIALTSDHAFPFFIGTSGRTYAVESTMIGGGRGGVNRAASFDDALTRGMRMLRLVQDGEYPGGPGILVGMSQGRSMGVFPPELAAHPAGTLEAWGLRPGRREARP
jgi:hypothetical protein